MPTIAHDCYHPEISKDKCYCTFTECTANKLSGICKVKDISDVIEGLHEEVSRLNGIIKEMEENEEDYKPSWESIYGGLI